MNAFQDLAEMTRDYGLIRYFIMVTMVVAVLVVILFMWGHVPEGAEEAPQPAAPPASTAAPTSY
ncbi:conserved protein of unknown function [Magnetospirillum sp. XM-1]|uniref:hypothetical protein n=1 Tax=Magnetospirillum sp. XM-1 TaxID=1663591 RepID=UPI00073DBD2B|nr:hypothetical protein [Magnetospirillum sp. XM-1]CUW38401.1 conserved protein of unknown function [Magnetospirillum sp. XM-1]